MELIVLEMQTGQVDDTAITQARAQMELLFAGLSSISAAQTSSHPHRQAPSVLEMLVHQQHPPQLQQHQRTVLDMLQQTQPQMAVPSRHVVSLEDVDDDPINLYEEDGDVVQPG